MKSNSASSWELLIVLFLCVIAAGLAIYATIHTIQFQKYGQIAADLCYLSKQINCEATHTSRYAILAGMPIAWFGFLYYIWIAITFLWASFRRSERNNIITKSFILSLLALIVTLYMLYLMAFKVKMLCPSCILMHTINICIFLILKRNLALSYKSIPKHLKQCIIDSIGKRANREHFIDNFKYAISALLFLVIGLEVIDFVSNQNLAPSGIIDEIAVENRHDAIRINKLVEPGSFMSYGPKDAPVQFVVFTDFECFYCSQAHKDINTILKEYPGKIHVVIKNFPLPFHERAKPAALAALAAARQNKYWEYSNLLFTNQNHLEDDDLLEYAQGTKLDPERFSTDLRDPEIEDLLFQDIEYANQLGIYGTPTLFINGKKMINALSVANLRFSINDVLERGVNKENFAFPGGKNDRSQYTQANIMPVNIAGDMHSKNLNLFSPSLWLKAIISAPQELLDKSKRSSSHVNTKYSKSTKTSCDSTKIKEVLAPATNSAKEVLIDCHLSLKSIDTVTKRLILEGPEATGVTVNCNGATLNGGKGTINDGSDMIEVKSKSYILNEERIWERPENITIRNCNIIGSVRIWGMARNGEGPDLKESSRREKSIHSGHVTRARNSAPKNIVFDNIIVTGVGSNPVYFAPGVTYSKLINSEVKGNSDRVAIYLDAESAHNTIKNNSIHVVTGDEFGREAEPLIAIDGSSYNKVMNNKFSSLNHGGIYLYRNCGFTGTIRHSTPSHNMIINNIFYYKEYNGPNPAVYLGAHDGGFWRELPYLGTCDDDNGRPYGSSASNRDFARHNVVMQNQFYKRKVYQGNILIEASIDDYIKSRNWENNCNNYIDQNQIVTAETVIENRRAGCYITRGYKNFILHGQSIDVLLNEKGEPSCPGYKYMCYDGDLSQSTTSDCKITKVSFDCLVDGNNNGCSKIVSCPSGQRIVGVTAACNLEFGTISDATLATVPMNTIKVIIKSDDVSDGLCYVDDTRLKEGQKTIIGINDLHRVSVGCKEHDKNGGDCHIKGILYCR